MCLVFMVSICLYKQIDRIVVSGVATICLDGREDIQESLMLFSKGKTPVFKSS